MQPTAHPLPARSRRGCPLSVHQPRLCSAFVCSMLLRGLLSIPHLLSREEKSRPAQRPCQAAQRSIL